MRLDFNVLWVEDQQSLVESQRERIDLLVRREGFRLQVKFAASVAEAVEVLSDTIFVDHIDMILMDYDLGNGPKGDEGLNKIRAQIHFKDIVFYSSQASDLPGIVLKWKLQGVFCSGREDLPDNVLGVFETLVKKVLDIDHSRGLVMGATSEIDQAVRYCLQSAYEDLSPENQSALMDDTKEMLAEKKAGMEEVFQKLQTLIAISDIYPFHNIYTSKDRLELLRKAYKKAGNSTNDQQLVKYIVEVLPKRNDLAHLDVHVDGFSRKLITKKGVEYTPDIMRELRTKLLESQEFFESLVSTSSKGS